MKILLTITAQIAAGFFVLIFFGCTHLAHTESEPNKQELVPAHSYGHRGTILVTPDPYREPPFPFSVIVERSRADQFKITILLHYDKHINEYGTFEAAIVESGKIMFSCPIERIPLVPLGKRDSSPVATLGIFSIDSSHVNKCQVLISNDFAIDRVLFAIPIVEYMPVNLPRKTYFTEKIPPNLMADPKYLPKHYTGH